jgi:hypothetical protein
MAHNKRCPSLHNKCYPRQNARAFSAAIVAKVRLNISDSACRERDPKSERWPDSIQTGSVPLASGADQSQAHEAAARRPFFEPCKCAKSAGAHEYRVPGTFEALNSLFAREGLQEITTTTIDVTRDLFGFKPIFNPITGMITSLPESDRVRLIESVQAGVPAGPGAPLPIEQRECYQGQTCQE